MAVTAELQITGSSKMANAYLTCSSHIIKDNIMAYHCDVALENFWIASTLFSRSERRHLAPNIIYKVDDDPKYTCKLSKPTVKKDKPWGMS